MFIRSRTTKHIFFAAVSFLISFLMLYSWATFKGVPPRSDLQAASGSVAWVQSGKYGIKFRLNGVPQSFDYASKGKAIGLVYDTLSRTDHPVVTVLFYPGHASGPIYSKDTFNGVYELSISGKPFRSRNEIDAAWRSDEKVGAWLGAIFIVIGVYLSFCALRGEGAT
jgi:hypothetical protein